MSDDDYSRSPDKVLASEKIVAGRKIFFLDFKENSRGRVLKITEDVNGRRDTIMVPDEALDDFYEALGRILDADDAAHAAGDSDY
ncbi:MAG: DNA-binding protein [Chthoniobacterales bacterium]|nr:DNA-binding protein [Chthoniobacterales bacterium]